MVLVQTLALAASQVFATSLDSYFQLTVMLIIMIVGVTTLSHLSPFEDRLSQNVQVSADFLLCGFLFSVCTSMLVILKAPASTYGHQLSVLEQPIP